MKSCITKSEDLSIIAKQLGRRPRGRIRVGSRCDFGYPRVLITPPMVDGVIFPTTYWLSCPDLVKKISRLEDLGFITTLKEYLIDDDDWQEKLKISTEAQIRERIQLDRGYSEEQQRGIAGVKDMSVIKCLHAHYADYLINNINPIGGEVGSMLAEMDVICVKGNLKC